MPIPICCYTLKCLFETGLFNILYPNGIQPYQYGDLLTIVRMLDKVFRIANMPSEDKDIMGEEPYKDIAGYALLALERERAKDVV